MNLGKEPQNNVYQKQTELQGHKEISKFTIIIKISAPISQ